MDAKRKGFLGRTLTAAAVVGLGAVDAASGNSALIATQATAVALGPTNLIGLAACIKAALRR